ncbi:hypothetical protein LPSP5_000196, partial [Lacticaseibacillus paracasei]|uniref:hypothetical protein n=1 Tax=Lacticaseibacillus paracasei TaxID=1597 RepID=UPI002019650A
LRPLIFDYVATHSGWLKSTDLRQKGACNQGKRSFEAVITQSWATPPTRLLLEKHSIDSMAKCALNFD